MEKGIVLLVVASLASAALGVPQMQFYVDRDNGFDENAVLADGGAESSVRGAKKSWREDVSAYGWDAEAISNWIAANGGMAAVQKVELFIMPKSDPLTGAAGIRVGAFYSQNDWVEGDGTHYNWGSLNWSEGTGAATYSYAETYWKWTDDTHTAKEVDTALTKAWTDLAGNPLPPGGDNGFDDAPTTWNSTNYFGQNGANAYSSVVVDMSLFEDLLDPDTTYARGLYLADMNNSAGNENWEVYMKEAGADKAAYLEVTVPEPATMLLLGLGGLGVLIRRKRQATA